MLHHSEITKMSFAKTLQIVPARLIYNDVLRMGFSLNLALDRTP